MNIPENDPRLRAAQEAVARDRAKRGARPVVESGPDFRQVHIPDAAPGHETLLVEVPPENASQEEPQADGLQVLVFVFFVLPLILGGLPFLWSGLAVFGEALAFVLQELFG